MSSDPAVIEKPAETTERIEETSIVPISNDRSFMSGLRDATGNPDWETDIIVMQARDHYNRGVMYSEIIRNPESSETDRRWAQERIAARENSYQYISPSEAISRKQKAVANLLNFLKYLAVIIVAAVIGNGLSLL
jgi:hypothetical protein